MVVRYGELPAVVLQVRSLLDGTGPPKKVRATLRGIMARRLAAHRRLIAAISVMERVEVISDPVARLDDVFIVSAVSGDAIVPADDGWALLPLPPPTPPL